MPTDPPVPPDPPMAPDSQAAADPWEIPGQQRAAAVLRAAAVRGELGHAWAFTGPRGVGQDRAARALVATLACEAEEPPCGHCDVCERALRSAHPALEDFPPSGPQHRVDDVRDRWLRSASRTSVHWKVLRIPDADRMTDAAANAFLKGLEEPPPRTVWLLEVADPQALPETILSRCRALRFAPLDTATLEAEAARRGIDEPTDRALAARVCLGTPDRLDTLAARGLDGVRAHRALPRRLREGGQGQALVVAKEIEDEAKATEKIATDEHDEALERLRTAHGDAPPKALERELSERHERRKRDLRTAAAQQALDDIAAWYRDVLLVQAGSAEGPGGSAGASAGGAADLGTDEGAEARALVHVDAVDELVADAQALSPAVVLSALDEVLATRGRLETAVTVRLALEAAFLRIAAVSMRG